MTLGEIAYSRFQVIWAKRSTRTENWGDLEDIERRAWEAGAEAVKQELRRCPHCNGTGKAIVTATNQLCGTCNGTGQAAFG
jgi:RecJ-like exonuclease